MTRESNANSKKRNSEVVPAFPKDRWLSLLKNKIDKTPVDKITNSRTVEIKLINNPVDFRKWGELTTSFLSNGDLVYVRSGGVSHPELNFARIQWLSPETPLFAPCDLTIEW